MSISNSHSTKAQDKKRKQEHTEGWLPGHSDLDAPIEFLIALLILAAMLVISYIPANKLFEMANIGPHPTQADIIKAIASPMLALLFSLIFFSAVPNQIKTFWFDKMPNDEKHRFLYHLNRWSAFVQLLAELGIVIISFFALFQTHDVFLLLRGVTGQL